MSAIGANEEQSSNQAVSRAELIMQIEARLAGRLSDAALSAWAFERFYDEEIGALSYEVGAEAVIADTLDMLMFCDDPVFQLGEEELRALLTRLKKL